MSSAAADIPFSSTRFEVSRVLGRGGMGVVYEAFDRHRRSRVALKTLPVPGAGLLLRLKNEFRQLQDLHHPNLVSLGELLEEQGQLFFTMELVKGTRFTEYVRGPVAAQRREEVAAARTETQTVEAHGTTRTAQCAPPEGLSTFDADKPIGRGLGASPFVLDPPVRPPPRVTQPRSPRAAELFDEARLREALRQLALGLAALHRAGKIHRDIKPSNVLVSETGRVVILDFGLVTELGRGDQAVVGTAQFMAPEQAAGRPVGPEADWYSVGVMLYLVLTRRYPYEASSEVVLELKTLVDPFPPRDHVPDVPEDLAALAMELLRRDPATRPRGSDLLRRLGVAETPEDELVPLSSAAFVGRRQELGVLWGAFRAVRQRERGIVVLVEGESGMGKSALVRRFVQEVRAGEGNSVDLPSRLHGERSEAGLQPLVLTGRCYERERVPYKAVDQIIDGLSHLLAEPPLSERAGLLPDDISLVARVFPVLRGAASVAALPAPPSLDPIELRARVFAALRLLLSRLAADRPVLLAIDDLQWADAESLALLSELMRPPFHPGVLLLVTLRTGSGGAIRADGARRIFEPEVLRTILVAPLEASEAEALARRILQDTGQSGLGIDTRALVEEAGGHPFFLDAMLRYRLLRSGAHVNLEDALWSRIEHLDPPSRRLLELTAVAGGPVSFELAAHATTGDLDEVSRWLAPLRVTHLVRTSGDGDRGEIETYHDRIRETVAHRLSPEVKATWHGRLAFALEAVGASELEALASHWAEAGHQERAAFYAARAADRAAEVLAFDRAARLYRRALELHRWTDAEAASLRARLGDALANAGRGKEAADAYLAAAPGVAPDQELELRRRAAENLLRSGHFEEGAACMEAVLGAVGMRSPATPLGALSMLLLRRARLRLRGLAFDDRGAREPPRSLLTRIDVCWSAAIGFGMNDSLRGSAFQTQQLLLALDAGDLYRAARAIALEIPFVATDGIKAARRLRELVSAAEPAARRSGHPHALALVPGVQGVSMFLLGQFRDSVAKCDASDHLLRTTCSGVHWERGSVRTFAVWSLWFLGELQELARRMPAYLRDASERGDRYLATNLSAFVANAYWLVRDEPEEADVRSASAFAGWPREGSHLQQFYSLVARAQLELYRGDPLAAERAVAEHLVATERSLALRIQLVRICLDFLRANIALAAATEASDGAARIEFARRAARRLERERAPWARPHAALIRSQVALAAGDREQSKRWLEGAIAGFEIVGMGLYGQVARLRLGQLVGGDDGKQTIDGAVQWMRDQGIVRPERLLAVLAPRVP